MDLPSDFYGPTLRRTNAHIVNILAAISPLA